MFSRTNFDDDIQTLTGLGLTKRQSKIYLILSEMEKATISMLSSKSRMDRANVYRTMKELHQLNLVEKCITNPAAFKTLPINEGIMLLIERRRIDFKKNEDKAKVFLKRYEPRSEINEDKNESQFVLVPGEKLTFRRLEKLIGSSKESHDGILFYSDIALRKDYFTNFFQKLSLKGLKLRLAIYTDTKEDLTFFEFLKNYKEIEIKKAGTRPRGTLSIWDKKTAFITTEPTISKPMTAGLLIDNPTTVGIIQEYFELIWQHSKSVHIA